MPLPDEAARSQLVKRSKRYGDAHSRPMLLARPLLAKLIGIVGLRFIAFLDIRLISSLKKYLKQSHALTSATADFTVGYTLWPIIKSMLLNAPPGYVLATSAPLRGRLAAFAFS
ncbi:hypothetical protein SODALDRAFT_319122 [Sodiomyces alkalinus F11]|uniref:Uncharacterized protein n=1 Tax=Sodiomyces alkalinus (strain CBS 110278 / VKM F-3762 / F11) TaxID=1314773 RepID=A0A3N2Q6P4_SODAK|nr:hypothetical protein SODALDRAFT_319122 [Sodiomyces alkalinus F11]ROT42441.1 hypothetical protein SODALDRAFT_319122 [Sodiomyces alkalinus F11]